MTGLPSVACLYLLNLKQQVTQKVNEAHKFDPTQGEHSKCVKGNRNPVQCIYHLYAPSCDEISSDFKAFLL